MGYWEEGPLSSVLSLALFKIFINDLGNETECTLSVSALSEAVAASEDRIRTQNDLDMLGKWPEIN